MLGECIASPSEAIRAIVSDYSPCCGARTGTRVVLNVSLQLQQGFATGIAAVSHDSPAVRREPCGPRLQPTRLAAGRLRNPRQRPED